MKKQGNHYAPPTDSKYAQSAAGEKSCIGFQLPFQFFQIVPVIFDFLDEKLPDSQTLFFILYFLCVL